MLIIEEVDLSDINAAKERALALGKEIFDGVFRALGSEIVAINKANGWTVTTPDDWTDRDDDKPKYAIPALIAEAHLRLSRILEAYRKGECTNKDSAALDRVMIATDHRADPDPAFETHNLNPRLPAVMALIHSEVSEATESIYTGDLDNFAEEMADVLIRVLDCTHGLGINVGEAIVKKLRRNKGRGFRHGGKVV